MYNGEYESELDYDENGWPWWESDSYAIWWSDNAWRVGPKENREANPNDAAFVSTSNRLCPHHFWLSDGQYVDDFWSYVGADGELEDAGLHATKAAGGTVIANPCKYMLLSRLTISAFEPPLNQIVNTNLKSRAVKLIKSQDSQILHHFIYIY